MSAAGLGFTVPSNDCWGVDRYPKIICTEVLGIVCMVKLHSGTVSVYAAGSQGPAGIPHGEVLGRFDSAPVPGVVPRIP